MTMKMQLGRLLVRFFQTWGVKGKFDRRRVVVEFDNAPHPRPTPLRGQVAVYLFFKGDAWLKVGKATYPARFTSQHYGTNRSGSSIAKDIWSCREEFGFQGEEAAIDVWLCENLGRANIRAPEEYGDRFVKYLEAFLHFHLQPRFEGRRPRAENAQD
ncbi:hypothetical protein [Shimia thalassica]|uniref:hypothetical protein n=1 Tax=Shimia thalassica TaxID=1715693 RepID=UPI0026E29EB4|nr:hypothetical protein [Shimia thalassica]